MISPLPSLRNAALMFVMAVLIPMAATAGSGPASLSAPAPGSTPPLTLTGTNTPGPLTEVPGMCAKFLTFTVTANNNTGNVTFSVSSTPGSAMFTVLSSTPTSVTYLGAFPPGNSVVTVTGVDEAAASAQLQFNVTSVDTQPPVFTNCPSNQVLNVAPACSGVANWSVGVSDNCPSVSISTTHNPGSTFSAGVTTVVYTATDAVGNTATCTFTITVPSDVSSITCIGSPTVSLDANGSYDVQANLATDVALSATLACTNGVITYTASPATLGCDNLSTPVTITASAGAATQSCVVTYTVQDATPPTITCVPSANGVLDNAGGYAITDGGQSFVTSANDNCGTSGLTYSVSQSIFDCFDIAASPIAVVVTVTDPSGQSANCTVNLSIVDDLPPYLIDPTEDCATLNQTVPTDGGPGCSFIVPDLTSNVFALYDDNCSTVSPVTQLPTAGSTANGSATVTFNIVDGFGNMTTCQVVLTADDVDNPTVTCPANTSLTYNMNCEVTLTAALLEGTFADNCSSSPASVSATSDIDGPLNIGSAALTFGAHTITITVEDAAGNTADCSYTLTVDDSTDPIVLLGCNAVYNTSTSPGVCKASAYQFDAPDFDDCSLASDSYTVLSSPGGAGIDNVTYNGLGLTFEADFYLGETVIQFVVTDGAGNTSACTVKVVVADEEEPAITCPANTTVSAGAGICTATVPGLNVTATDNCTVAVDFEFSYTLTGATSGSATSSGSPLDLSSVVFNVGSTVVTATVSDEASNTKSCSFTVTVTDDEDPTIVCPANQTLNTSADGTGDCTTIAAGLQVTGSDNCTSNANLAFTYTITGATATTGSGTGTPLDLSSVLFAKGTSTVTAVVSDQAGNTASCNFTVTVSDDEAPVFTNCPTSVITANTSDDATGDCATTITAGLSVAATDNCDAASAVVFTYSISGATTVASTTSTGSPLNLGTQLFNKGTSTITVNISDSNTPMPNSNPTPCVITVNVSDNEVPVVACPANLTALTSDNGTGDCATTISGLNVSATDNCDPAAALTVTYSVSGATSINSTTLSGSPLNLSTLAFNKGVSTVSLTFSDANTPTANTSVTCTFTVTVADDEVPTVACPANQTITTSSNGTGDCAGSYTIMSPVSDNCTGSTWGATFSGNANGNPSALSGISQGSNSNVTFQAGVTTVELSGTDAVGNVAVTCSFTVTVNDDENPSLVCPSNQTVSTSSNGSGDCTGSYTINDPVTDNCPGSTWGATFSGNTAGNPAAISGINDGSNSSAINFQIGTTTVTLSAADASSNMATTCTFTVTVVDDEPPAMPTCPANQTVTTDPNACTKLMVLTINNSTVTSNDNCGTATVLSASSVGTPIIHLGSGVYLGNFSGVTTITVVVSDGATPTPNTSTCTFTVTVNDGQAPTLAGCPLSVNANNAPGMCGGPVFWNPPIASDNCTGVTMTASHFPGMFFNVGTTTVTYTATNNSQSTTCTFNVVVTDNQPPTITNCPGNMTLGTSPTSCDATLNWAPIVATDNCPGSVTIASSIPNGSTLALGSVTTVTITATDAASVPNTSTCTFTVTVVDNVPPTAICKNASVNLSAPTIMASALNNGSSDNCSLAAMPFAASKTTFTCADVPSTVVTLTVTDNAGNTATCTSTVTVNDDVAPVAVCQGASVTVDANTGSVNLSTAAVNNGSSDNCTAASALTLALDKTSFTCADAGNNTVTLTVTDAAGNSSNCTAIVVVNTPTFSGTASPASLSICSGASISISLSSSVTGATFAWSRDNTTNVTGVPASGSSTPIAGTLSNSSSAAETTVFTITPSANGCTGTPFTSSVSVNPVPTASTSSSDLICVGQSGTWTANLTGIGPWTLNYTLTTTSGTTSHTTNATTSPWVVTESPTETVTVTLTSVTDANGCPGTVAPSTATITVQPLPTVTTGTYPDQCGLASPTPLTLSGASFGGSASSAAWSIVSGGGTLSSTALTTSPETVTYTPAPNFSGNVVLRLTSDDPAGPCASVFADVTITYGSGPSATASVTHVTCNGGNNGAIDLTTSTGNTFAWSNNASTEDINGLTAGTYTVTITGANGCSSTATFVVNQPAPLVASANIVTPIVCNGGNATITVTASGGTAPYTGTITTSVSSGTYTYTVTDANGCTANATITVTEPAALTVSTSVIPVTCNGGNDGSATATPAGGTAPYTYAWSNSSVSATATGLAAGTFTVTVTDNNGCSVTSSVVITQPTGCPTVSNVTVSNILKNEATLSWPNVPCATLGYRIQYRVNLGSGLFGPWTIANLPAGTTTYVAEDLTPLQRYQFRVISRCATGQSPFFQGSFVTKDDLYLDADCDGSGGTLLGLFDTNVPGDSPELTAFMDANYPGYTGCLVFASGDCDDNNASINPSAVEVCDLLDNDCDGLVDEGVTTTYYFDLDGDGFGDQFNTTAACTQPAGYVTNALDCNDFDNMVNPNATEVCNGVDDNCNGLIDDGNSYVCPASDVTLGGLVTTNITATSAKLNWNPVACAQAYRLQYRRNSVVPHQWTWILVNAPNTSITISGLVPSNLYRWFIRNRCYNGVFGAGPASGNQQALFTTLPSALVAQNSGLTTAVSSGDARLFVYPNPSSGTTVLTVDGISDQQVRLSLTDNLGRVLFNWNASASSGRLDTTFDMGDLPEGIYNVRVQTVEGVITTSVMKK